MNLFFFFIWDNSIVHDEMWFEKRKRKQNWQYWIRMTKLTEEYNILDELAQVQKTDIFVFIFLSPRIIKDWRRVELRYKYSGLCSHNIKLVQNNSYFRRYTVNFQKLLSYECKENKKTKGNELEIQILRQLWSLANLSLLRKWQ